MKLLPSDPDIRTIVSRILNDELDLQPNFQRGEVWSDAKKRRLIDSILRDWHVPPIHVIETPDKKQEVLDGQQRLVAIRDFVNGIIKVDGDIQPLDRRLAEADGCTYATLPIPLRRQFDQFTIRVFRLIDYTPEEPGELFYRLNQPTSLTAAEQRNAFFGPVREQVRDFSSRFATYGLDEAFVGFSNSRMAYDDILAKVCISLERGTLADKLSAATITERYRSREPLSEEVIRRVNDALKLLGTANRGSQGTFRPHFNKATFFSWICFCLRLLSMPNASQLSGYLPDYLKAFESERQASDPGQGGRMLSRTEHLYRLLELYSDRASARVSDVFSVLARDIVILTVFGIYLSDIDQSPLLSIHPISLVYGRLGLPTSSFPAELRVAAFVQQENWGSLP